MSASTKIARLITGTLLVIIIIVATFVLLARWPHTWGATEAEVARMWRWHTGWCPGWKAYQAHLVEQAKP